VGHCGQEANPFAQFSLEQSRGVIFLSLAYLAETSFTMGVGNRLVRGVPVRHYVPRLSVPLLDAGIDVPFDTACTGNLPDPCWSMSA
jgi:hypothetical protein